MIEAYKEYWKRYVDFKGETSRRNFWLTVLASFIVGFIISFVVSLIFGNNAYVVTNNSYSLNLQSPAGIIIFIWGLINFLPSLAIDIRRLHDIDKSGWWVLLAAIPIVGQIILLVWYCKKGKN